MIFMYILYFPYLYSLVIYNTEFATQSYKADKQIINTHNCNVSLFYDQ